MHLTNLTYLARGSSGGVCELSSYARLACNKRTDLVEGVLRTIRATGGFARPLIFAWNAWEAITGACERRRGREIKTMREEQKNKKKKQRNNQPQVCATRGGVPEKIAFEEKNAITMLLLVADWY